MCNTHTEIQYIDMAVLICKTFLMFGMFLDNLHFFIHVYCIIIWNVLFINVQVKPGYRAKKMLKSTCITIMIIKYFNVFLIRVLWKNNIYSMFAVTCYHISFSWILTSYWIAIFHKQELLTGLQNSKCSREITGGHWLLYVNWVLKSNYWIAVITMDENVRYPCFCLISICCNIINR